MATFIDVESTRPQQPIQVPALGETSFRRQIAAALATLRQIPNPSRASQAWQATATRILHTQQLDPQQITEILAQVNELLREPHPESLDLQQETVPSQVHNTAPRRHLQAELARIRTLIQGLEQEDPFTQDLMAWQANVTRVLPQEDLSIEIIDDHLQSLHRILERQAVVEPEAREPPLRGFIHNPLRPRHTPMSMHNLYEQIMAEDRLWEERIEITNQEAQRTVEELAGIQEEALAVFTNFQTQFREQVQQGTQQILTTQVNLTPVFAYISEQVKLVHQEIAIINRSIDQRENDLKALKEQFSKLDQRLIDLHEEVKKAEREIKKKKKEKLEDWKIAVIIIAHVGAACIGGFLLPAYIESELGLLAAKAGVQGVAILSTKDL